MSGWEDRIGAAGTATALLIWMVLLPDIRRSAVARYLLGFYAGIISYYLTPIQSGDSLPTIVRALLFIARLGGLYFLWLAVRAAFRDDYKPVMRHQVIYFAAIATSMGAILLVNRSGLMDQVDIMVRDRIAGIVPALWSVAFLVLTVREAMSGWSSDMVNTRRNFRAMLILAVVGTILGIMILRISYGPTSARPWILLLGLAIQFIFAVAFLRARDELYGNPPARRKYVPDGEIGAKLERAMNLENLYREEALTIRKLAGRLDEPEYRLRLHINNGLGFRNFNHFLNSFRIKEACAILRDPTMNDMTILRISLDLGFGSISSFNKAFRDIMAMTPTQFRARPPQ